MDDHVETIAAKLANAAPGAMLESAFALGELTLTVDSARVIEALHGDIEPAQRRLICSIPEDLRPQASQRQRGKHRHPHAAERPRESLGG